jgi:hypothetical protein
MCARRRGSALTCIDAHVRALVRIDMHSRAPVQVLIPPKCCVHSEGFASINMH